MENETMTISNFISKMDGAELLDLRKVLHENKEVQDAVKRFKKNYKGKNVDLDLIRYGYIIGKYRLVNEDEIKKRKSPQKPLVKRKKKAKSHARKGVSSDISKRGKKESRELTHKKFLGIMFV